MKIIGISVNYVSYKLFPEKITVLSPFLLMNENDFTCKKPYIYYKI